MADVLSEIRSSLEKRLRELEPLSTEHAHVRKALDALEEAGKRAAGTAGSAAKRSRAVKANGAVPLSVNLTPKRSKTQSRAATPG
jgi:hypothetical protein